MFSGCFDLVIWSVWAADQRSPTHSTVVYNLHVHVHADFPNVDTTNGTEWSEDPQLLINAKCSK